MSRLSSARRSRKVWKVPEVAESLSKSRDGWDDIKPLLNAAAQKISVKRISGGSEDVLDYQNAPDGASVIAVGGDKLSRGLTLEGLSTSYFLRPSKMYDTLMQMGRGSDSDDKVLASCVIDLIHTVTPIEAVASKNDADVVLKVSAHIPGAGARFALGMMGGTPSAKMEAQLPDGTLLWSDGAKNRKLTGGAIGAARNGDKLACGLANGLLTALRDAMGRARGK